MRWAGVGLKEEQLVTPVRKNLNGIRGSKGSRPVFAGLRFQQGRVVLPTNG